MSKRNAQQELLSAMVQDGDHLLPSYGRISYEPYHGGEQIEVEFSSLEEFNKILPRLDFEYNNGYGTQELFGTVVFADGTWLTRGEYDGSEWWDYHKCPSRSQVIPSEVV
jgi:hypothetical protein